jgi:hypothetical protein
LERDWYYEDLGVESKTIHRPKESKMLRYRELSLIDAIEMVLAILPTILAHFDNWGDASDDLRHYDGAESYVEKHFLNKHYSVSEAIRILQELEQHKENDKRLWMGMDAEDAISVQAAHTYLNAVEFYFRKIIGEINDRSKENDCSLDAILGTLCPYTRKLLSDSKAT